MGTQAPLGHERHDPGDGDRHHPEGDRGLHPERLREELDESRRRGIERVGAGREEEPVEDLERGIEEEHREDPRGHEADRETHGAAAHAAPERRAAPAERPRDDHGHGRDDHDDREAEHHAPAVRHVAGFRRGEGRRSAGLLGERPGSQEHLDDDRVRHRPDRRRVPAGPGVHLRAPLLEAHPQWVEEEPDRHAEDDDRRPHASDDRHRRLATGPAGRGQSLPPPGGVGGRRHSPPSVLACSHHISIVASSGAGCLSCTAARARRPLRTSRSTPVKAWSPWCRRPPGPRASADGSASRRPRAAARS